MCFCICWQNKGLHFFSLTLTTTGGLLALVAARLACFGAQVRGLLRHQLDVRHHGAVEGVRVLAACIPGARGVRGAQHAAVRHLGGFRGDTWGGGRADRFAKSLEKSSQLRLLAVSVWLFCFGVLGNFENFDWLVLYWVVLFIFFVDFVLFYVILPVTGAAAQLEILLRGEVFGQLRWFRADSYRLDRIWRGVCENPNFFKTLSDAIRDSFYALVFSFFAVAAFVCRPSYLFLSLH